MTRVRHAAALALALVAFTAPLACSDDTREATGDAARSAADDVQEGVDDAGDAVGEGAAAARARAAAEDLRARIKANDTANAEGARSVTAIEEASADVALSPDFTGVEDSDDDGLDDDGKVQVEVDGATACVSLPASGKDTTVESGDC